MKVREYPRNSTDEKGAIMSMMEAPNLRPRVQLEQSYQSQVLTAALSRSLLIFLGMMVLLPTVGYTSPCRLGVSSAPNKQAEMVTYKKYM